MLTLTSALEADRHEHLVWGGPYLAGDVFVLERREHIARFIEEHGRARVAELAKRFGVSQVTIRKDLLSLESSGRVVRAHGGALSPVRERPERAFDVRERLQREEKEAIGAAAALLVEDGSSVALDASTTALYLARALKSRGGWNQLTVITNGIRIASELAGHPGITLAMPGGWVRWEALSLVGGLGEGVFGRVNVHTAFVGAAGFTLRSGLADSTEEEAQIKRSMIAAAREVVAIIDHTKWGKTAFATFCPTANIGRIVTDGGAPSELVHALGAQGIVTLRADRAGSVADSGSLADATRRM
jgi:DeoR/GlpR family transcriptional regulator of sugar metabolism